MDSARGLADDGKRCDTHVAHAGRCMREPEAKYFRREGGLGGEWCDVGPDRRVSDDGKRCDTHVAHAGRCMREPEA